MEELRTAKSEVSEARAKAAVYKASTIADKAITVGSKKKIRLDALPTFLISITGRSYFLQIVDKFVKSGFLASVLYCGFDSAPIPLQHIQALMLFSLVVSSILLWLIINHNIRKS